MGEGDPASAQDLQRVRGQLARRMLLGPRLRFMGSRVASSKVLALCTSPICPYGGQSPICQQPTNQTHSLGGSVKGQWTHGELFKRARSLASHGGGDFMSDSNW